VLGSGPKTIRVSTTASRLKARNLRRDPRAALHVSGDNFWAYAVAEGEASWSEIAAAPGDAALTELLLVHSAFYGAVPDLQGFAAEMITNQRLVTRPEVQRVHGLVAKGGPRPVTKAEDGVA
jgi:hypothetical protein